MKKIIAAIVILFLFASGCVQTSSDETDQYSEYSDPNSGFTMKYPTSWDVNPVYSNLSIVEFESPDNQASMRISIKQTYHPEGEEEGGIGISYDVPNSTPIESSENIQISNAHGLKWTFLVDDGDREYIDGIIIVKQKCPELQNNRIFYHIRFVYPNDDQQLESTMRSMVDSIDLSCPFGE